MRLRSHKRSTGLKFNGAARFGFTLIELVLATAIATLVIGMLSVCLSFSLRAWESTQNRSVDRTANLIDMFKCQLSEFDPTPIKFTEGARLVFSGASRSIAFATSHSVKAISKGVPVIAHYVFDPGAKVLYYSEIPLDPYHPRAAQAFIKATPAANEKAKYRFFPIDISQFELSYAGKDDDHFAEVWDRDGQTPAQVLLKWENPDIGQQAQVLIVNCPFTIQPDKMQLPLNTLMQGGIQQ